MSTITPTAHVADFAKMKRIVRFIGVRLLLALVTLWLLSMIVFAGGQLLPGDVGRAILGPLADARAVAALNHQLGVDRPLFTQYSSWIGHFLRGDMGESYAFRAPVAPFIGNALWSSAKLGALAFVVVVPLGIAGGVYAALHAGRWIDRVISIGGLTATVVP
jgi:peptide/nickel transport system permease protein